MSNIGFNVIQSMYKHLVQSYDSSEAREILIQKYPDSEEEIMGLNESSDQNEVDASAEDTENEKLTRAVKQKTAKAPKAVKPVAEKKVSKMGIARDLYAKATDKSRKAMIEVFMKELGLPSTTASTYYYNIKD